MTIKAFGKYITVKKIDSDKKYSSGIVSKHGQQNLIVKGEVLSVGSHEDFYYDEDRKEPIIKPGDIVYVHEFPKDEQIDPETNEAVAFVMSNIIYGFESK